MKDGPGLSVSGATSDTERRRLRTLLICGCLIWVICLTLAVMSRWFAWGRPVSSAPVVTFCVLMAAAFCVHLYALRVAIRMKSHSAVCPVVLFLATAFRLALVPAHPILEIDIYRYMWDGTVLVAGSNPYQFSPRDILNSTNPDNGSDLAALCRLRNSSPQLHETLRRIHYPHLTTIYPPVSQMVFAAASAVVPVDASIGVRRSVMKLFIVVFDCLTMVMMLRLLRLFGMPPGWLICYAWSPLALKEFANSGHLDAVAVFFATASVVLWLEALQRQSVARLLFAAVVLGLAVGAKIYPVVIVPVVAATVLRHFGWRHVITSGSVFAAVSVVSLAPMVLTEPADVPVEQRAATATEDEYETDDGLSAFVRHWRMNDLFYQVLHENLKPGSDAWFVVLPDRVRSPVVATAKTWTGGTDADAVFLVARSTVALIHVMIVVWLAWVAYSASLRRIPALAFCAIAWFWILLPTQNPWYWIWAMPLLPFTRCRSWLLISGCVTLYYLHFHLQYAGDITVLGTLFSGRQFFHQVVVWLEHLPVLLCLAGEGWYRRGHRS